MSSPAEGWSNHTAVILVWLNYGYYHETLRLELESEDQQDRFGTASDAGQSRLEG